MKTFVAVFITISVLFFEVVTSFQVFHDDIQHCQSQRRTIYLNRIKVGTDIFDTGHGGNEGIVTESCVREGEGCAIPGVLSYAYRSRCQTKYATTVLYMINKNKTDYSEKLVQKSFQMPVGCFCVIKTKV